MNIDGFGDEIIEDFYNLGFIKNFDDFYCLDKYRNELMELEGFGDKSISNLLNSVNVSKDNSLERLLFALGIRYVGSKTAKILASHYQNIDNIIAATYDDLLEIRDIGNTIAKSVYEYFKNEDNLKLIQKLKDLGINMNYNGKKVVDNDLFSNKTFVLTGSLETITRAEAIEKIELLGGKATNSVTSKTDVVIVGSNPGSKYDKALKLNITIWREEEFLDKLNANN